MATYSAVLVEQLPGDSTLDSYKCTSTLASSVVVTGSLI